jgi:transposase
MPGLKAGAWEPDRVEIVTSVQRRRRWSLNEKLRAFEEASAPGMTVSYIARKYAMHPSLVFKWRRLMTEGGQEAVRADDQVVAAAEV